jgi:hypothetical protein
MTPDGLIVIDHKAYMGGPADAPGSRWIALSSSRIRREKH